MSSKTLSTLKGVFPPPRPPPKRNFIRENKQKLKAVQKFTAHLHENRENDEHCTRRAVVRQAQGPRSRSIPAQRILSGCSCASQKSLNTISSARLRQKPRRESINCDKSIQTDDIIDEAFLADALRRCSMKSQKYQISENPGCRSDFTENAFEMNHEHPSDENNLHVDLSEINDDNHLSEIQEPISRKSRAAYRLQDTHRDESSKTQQRTSNRSDLRNVRIPKYLEREKREKELQRIREMEKDPHCPEGHYTLSEEDRKAALTAAENKFRELINELNRMPMSGETLRIKTRKMEIERALIDLENTIRNFSKSKVYVKAEN